MSKIVLRVATVSDVQFITDVFNQSVRSSTCIFRDTLMTAADRTTWLCDRDRRHPVIIAELAKEPVGFGALGPFRAFPGFSATTEHCLYVSTQHHRKGVGTALLNELISRAKKNSFHAIIGGIAADQPPSLALHTKLGFSEVGRLPEVGRKFNRWLDLVFMQLIINDKK